MSNRSITLRLMRMGGAVLLAAAGFWAATLMFPLAQTPTAAADDHGRGPYIVLTNEFFEAMTKLSQANADTYGDLTQPLLQKIALASQFTVKTNLTLIKQNDRIIQLLEELNRKRLLQER